MRYKTHGKDKLYVREEQKKRKEAKEVEFDVTIGPSQYNNTTSASANNYFIVIDWNSFWGSTNTGISGTPPITTNR
jgi:hypothetical protein